MLISVLTPDLKTLKQAFLKKAYEVWKLEEKRAISFPWLKSSDFDKQMKSRGAFWKVYELTRSFVFPLCKPHDLFTFFLDFICQSSSNCLVSIALELNDGLDESKNTKNCIQKLGEWVAVYCLSVSPLQFKSRAKIAETAN